MQGTEDWLMNLPPSACNQLAGTSFRAVRIVKETVVWIPYGWVTMLVNCMGQLDVSQALIIPYLNAKLALAYPSLGILVNFHVEYVKNHKQNGVNHWKEHGDTYLEWLATLSSAVNTDTPPPNTPAIMDIEATEALAALTDGRVDDETQPRDIEMQQGEDSQPKDDDTPDGES